MTKVTQKEDTGLRGGCVSPSILLESLRDTYLPS